MSDSMAGVIGVLVMVGFFALLVYGVIWDLRRRRREAKLRFLCLDCESISPFQTPQRPFWPWLIVGPFALLWSKKLTCPTCKSHNLIPGESPKARKMAAGQ
jgi:RNase P subunit RPR2